MDSSLLPNVVNFLSQTDPFDNLPTDIQQQVAKVVCISYLEKGEHIYNQDQKDDPSLYIIRIGAIEQRTADNTLRAQLEAGDLFGFGWLNSSEEDDYYSVTAIENTLLYAVPHKELMHLLDKNPEYSAYFAAHSRTRLKQAISVKWSAEEKGVYVKTVGDIANRRVVSVDVNDAIKDVALKMSELHRSSAVVMENGQLVGIVNDRDMTKRVVSQGFDVTGPVKDVMTYSPITIETQDLVLKAVTLMMRYSVKSLPVTQNGEVVGIFTSVDLVQNNNMLAIYLINAISQARNIDDLKVLTPQRKAVFEALVNGEVSFNMIGDIMTLIIDSYTVRLLELAEMKYGVAPCEYTWIAAGSQARGEHLPHSDQDNALIVSRELDIQERQYFAQLTTFVNHGLADCDYPLCSGGYMASNPRWSQPLEQWKAYYKEWITEGEREALLHATVFMDIRCIHGSTQLFDDLHVYLHSLTSDNSRFLALLVANSLRIRPPLSIFKNFVLIRDGEHKNMLNLKKRSVNPLVDLGRVYSMAAGDTKTTNTLERFAVAKERGVINQETYADVIGAYEFISRVRVKYQLSSSEQGDDEFTHHISPDALTQFERNHLKEAFLIITQLQDASQMRFSSRGILR